MPSDLDLAVRRAKEFESRLERRFDARGRGLHEKIDSVRDDLPPAVVRDLRLVATVRNRIVHESSYQRIEGRGEFLAACRRARRALEGRVRRRLWWMILPAAAALIVFGVLALSRGQSPVQILTAF
jgi:hypothetical protein